jgi:hypothetical protein
MAADRMASRGPDHRHRGRGVHDLSDWLGMHLTAPFGQDPGQFVVSVAGNVLTSADHVQQCVIGLYRSEINRHLMRIAVGVTSAWTLVPTSHSDHPLGRQYPAQST